MPSRFLASSIFARPSTAAVVAGVALVHALGIGLGWAWDTTHSAPVPQAFARYKANTDPSVLHITLQTHTASLPTATALPAKSPNKRVTSGANHTYFASSHRAQSTHFPTKSKNNASATSIPSSELHTFTASPSPSSPSTSAAPSAQPTAPLCYAPPPHYPLTARRQGEYGTVLIRITVNAIGQVEQANLQRSSGFRRLDHAALKAAQHASCTLTPLHSASMPIYLQFRFDLLN